MAKKKHLSGIRFLMYLLVVLLVLTAIAACGAFFYLKHMLDGMNRVTMTSDKEELGITKMLKPARKLSISRCLV